jgi:hypothetical protein
MMSLKDWKTTIVGIIAIIFSVLVATGKVSADNAEQSQGYLMEIVSAVIGLILIFFAKDPKKGGG